VIDGTLLDSVQMPLPASSLAMAKRSMPTAAYDKLTAITLHAITYASHGLRIRGWMALPPATAERYPAVVFNRGGSGPKGALSPEGAMMYAGLFASWGFVAVASNYRGIGGSEGVEEWGAGDVDDALNLLPLLDALPYVDASRLGLVGGSRGGMMAFQMLARTSRFRAAITFGAPTAINAEAKNAYIRSTMRKYLAAGANEQAEAERRSVVCWANQLCPTTPLLVLHGTGDRRVPGSHALDLAGELQRLHFPYRLIMYENADHVLAGRRVESMTDMRWWLSTYVQSNTPLPRSGPHGA
jgi:dipeptidyl aminopeptidase/acylaminoacyl peptidase